MEVPQFNKMLCLFFVAGSLCKNPVRPAKLARWVVHVQGQLVLVIVEISVEDQHPETWSIQQIFCVISTYAKGKKCRQFKTQLDMLSNEFCIMCNLVIFFFILRKVIVLLLKE